MVFVGVVMNMVGSAVIVIAVVAIDVFGGAVMVVVILAIDMVGGAVMVVVVVKFFVGANFPSGIESQGIEIDGAEDGIIVRLKSTMMMMIMIASGEWR